MQEGPEPQDTWFLISRPGLLALDVSVQSQCHLLLQLINLFLLGNPRPVRREEDHGSHKHILRLLELQLSQCPMEAKK